MRMIKKYPKKHMTAVEVAAGGRNNDIDIVFKNCATFTSYISELSNIQIDHAKYIYVIIPMYI